MDQMWDQLVLGEGDCTVIAVWKIMSMKDAVEIFEDHWQNFAKQLGISLADIKPLLKRIHMQTTTTKDVLHEILTLYRAHNASAAKMSVIIEALQSIGATTAIELLQAKFLPNREEERQNNSEETMETETTSNFSYNLC